MGDRQKQGEWYSTPQAMRRRKVENFALSEASRAKLRAMADETGHPKSRLIDMAIHALWAQTHGGEKSKQKKSDGE